MPVLFQLFHYTKSKPTPKLANPLLANIRLNRGENEVRKSPVQKKQEEYEKYLGPGCYDMPREFDKNLGDIKGNPLVSKDKRFHAERKMGPGPGQYTNEEMNTWNRRTFNLLFSNE